MNGCPAPPGSNGASLGLVEDGIVAARDGRIVYAGVATGAPSLDAAETIDCAGRWITPGLVDCHTHLVFGGTRANEHAMRRAGATYEEIAKAGGGIASTVAATKASSADELQQQARRRLHALMAGGVTTVEIKSGYGLDTAAEMRLLNAARAIGRDEPVRIVTTLLAAHALPPEAAGDRGAYAARVEGEIDILTGVPIALGRRVIRGWRVGDLIASQRHRHSALQPALDMRFQGI